MSRQDGGGGSRIAVFGNGDGGADDTLKTPTVARAKPQTAPSTPTVSELAARLTASTREVVVCRERVSRILRKLADLGEGKAGAKTTDRLACTEQTVHRAYVRLSDALYAQRRAAVRLCRARHGVGRRAVNADARRQ